MTNVLISFEDTVINIIILAGDFWNLVQFGPSHSSESGTDGGSCDSLLGRRAGWGRRKHCRYFLSSTTHVSDSTSM